MFLALLACIDLSGTGPSDFQLDSGATDSGDTGAAGAGQAPIVTIAWDEEGLALTVVGGATGTYALGLAETGFEEGWYGEDCISGPGPNSGDYDLCHDAMSALGGRLETVYSPDDVVENSTTLFRENLADHVTYVLYDGRVCWTLGDDVSYYIEALGCLELG
ncbi:MAG: hypothetical protein FJ102_12200 [Deltaproteobacteria bacterium]|nr:hypothetical protein [Deltaproteobacteria bacterium]